MLPRFCTYNRKNYADKEIISRNDTGAACEILDDDSEYHAFSGSYEQWKYFRQNFLENSFV